MILLFPTATRETKPTFLSNAITQWSLLRGHPYHRRLFSCSLLIKLKSDKCQARYLLYVPMYVYTIIPFENKKKWINEIKATQLSFGTHQTKYYMFYCSVSICCGGGAFTSLCKHYWNWFSVSHQTYHSTQQFHLINSVESIHHQLFFVVFLKSSVSSSDLLTFLFLFHNTVSCPFCCGILFLQWWNDFLSDYYFF